MKRVAFKGVTKNSSKQQPNKRIRGAPTSSKPTPKPIKPKITKPLKDIVEDSGSDNEEEQGTVDFDGEDDLSLPTPPKKEYELFLILKY